MNKNLLTALNDRMLFIKSKNRYIKGIERLIKIMLCDVLVCSGVNMLPYEMKWVRLWNKKMIYIMHGCHLIEAGKHSRTEDFLLQYSKQILCVSETYKQLMVKLFPQYSSKMQVLTNAINWKEYTSCITNQENTAQRNPQNIVLIGGGRVLKRNYQVCQAVLNYNLKHGSSYKVDVYGYFRDNDDSKKIAEMPGVTFHHVVPHDEMLKTFSNSRLFIQASEFESFSLGVIEALACGCDLLISKNVGAKDVISGKRDCDVINDVFDVNEIEEKLGHVLKESNNQRLLQSIDRHTTSIEYSADKLLEYVDCMKRK